MTGQPAPGQSIAIASAATLLTLPGVPDALVMKEYLLTNEELLPAVKPELDHFRALGGDPDALRPLVAVAPEYLEAALDEMRKELGAIEGYFSEALKIDDGAQKALRAAFVESV